MEFFKSYYKIIAVSVFIILITIAHILAPPDFSFLRDPISGLGMQGYYRKIIMQLGFFLFGIILAAGIIMNRPGWRGIPILLYALGLAMAGVFCARPPLDSTIPYSQTEAFLHSFSAQMAGTAFCAGILVQLAFSKGSKLKLIHLGFLLLLVLVGLPLQLRLIPELQGLAQRLIFLISFTWLIGFFNLSKAEVSQARMS